MGVGRLFWQLLLPLLSTEWMMEWVMGWVIGLRQQEKDQSLV